MKKIISWVDPISNEALKEENGYLVSSSSRYNITNGIPNFVTKINKNQEQVKKTFGYKWIRSDFGQNDQDFENKIKQTIFNILGLSENDLQIFENKIVLDVGIGSGASARLWGTKAKEFHGIDISEAIYRVPNALKNFVKNPILSQADLNHLPYLDESFDLIASIGVFHHTPNTKAAIKNVIKKLKNGGQLLFYVYKKKSPIREFSDDFVRSKISDLHYDLAWKKMESITNFAKSLHDQEIKVLIPKDLEIFGIKKGEYDLQRFIYQYFFKCFWHEELGFDDSVMVNFDWYYPKFSWRQSEKEIRNWCKEFGLKIDYLKETDSGYNCLVTHNKK